MKTTILPIKNSVHGSPVWRAILLIALAPFALLSTARAEDGDLGNGNTAEGGLALHSLTSGLDNTATGDYARQNNTADNNTANGFAALQRNTSGTLNTATGYQALYTNATGID